MNPLEPALASTPTSTGLAMQALIASIRNPRFSVRHSIQPSVPPRLHSTQSVPVTHRMRETCHRRVLTHCPFPPIPHELVNASLLNFVPALTVSDASGRPACANYHGNHIYPEIGHTYLFSSLVPPYTAHAHTHTHTLFNEGHLTSAPHSQQLHEGSVASSLREEPLRGTISA